MSEQVARPSLRLTDDEIWEFVAGSHTGIMTTLRRDGMPIALPVWFVCLDKVHYACTMRWVRFTPDKRVLSWDNRKLAGERS